MAAIAIRQLTVIEQALSRGLPVALAELVRKHSGTVPVVTGGDGFTLMPALLRALGRRG